MARRMYEFMFLFDSSKTAGDVPASVQALHAMFEKYGAEVLASRPWNEQKLAYPIRHQKKGLYYLIYVRCESTRVHEIEADLRLNEVLLRYLPVVIDPKWEAEMLAVAKDEHALALQIGHNEEAIESNEGGYEGGPRRGPIPDEMMKE
jgi:small subunit ribosomal protein S6